MATNYNPARPVYVAPETLQPGADLTIDPAKATVEGRMTGLLSRDSDYMKLNEAKGLGEANRRGLLNTSMAVGMARKAAIEGALPIAQQDAKLYGSAGLNNQAAQLERQKAVNNAILTGSLTAQDYAGKYALQNLSDKAQLQRVNIDNQWKANIDLRRLDVEKQKSLVNFQTQLGAQLTGSIERIMRDDNVSNKTAAIKALMTNYKSQLQTAAAIIKIKLTW